MINTDACKDEPVLTVTPDGDKRWYLNGELHRLDDPAVEWANGAKE